MIKWPWNVKNPVLANRPQAKMEDLTYSRMIQEKMTSLEVGQQFAIATRDGYHIFKKVEIQPYKTPKK